MREQWVRAAAGWNRFWFQPTSTAPVEVFRIAFGALATAWMLAWLPVFTAFFGPRAAVPESPTLRSGAWTLFTLVGQSPLAWIVWMAGTVAAVLLTVGYRTRWAAAVVFLVMVSIARQAPWALNAGDMLLRVLAFYMILMPAGSSLSLDRLRTDPNRFWTFPHRAPWALRLLQIQLSVIYVSTVWEKSASGLWRQGTAVSYALRVEGLQRLRAPEFLTDSVILSQLATFGTLGLELAIGILVWNRIARPWVLGMGVLLHLSIDLTMTIGFFSIGMMVLYLSFLSPGAAERVVGAVRRRAARRRSEGRTSDDPVPDDGPGRVDGAAVPPVPEPRSPVDKDAEVRADAHQQDDTALGVAAGVDPIDRHADVAPSP